MPSQAKTVYLKPTSWVADGARFALYMYGGVSDAWANFELVDATNNIYKATFDDSQTNMIFCRMNGSSTENIWDNRWNQSDNLAAPTADNLLYTITEGRWGKDSEGTENGKIADGDGLTTEPYTEPAAGGYLMDFNTALAPPSRNTNNPLFDIAPGWVRIPDAKEGDGYGPYYMLYYYYATSGVDGSGTLVASEQKAPQSSYDGTPETTHDYIVTPKVSGTVTIQLKGSSSSPFVEFYTIDDNATTVGNALTATYSEAINTSSFVTATITLSEPTRIAIRAQYVYMDNFTATEAEIPEIRSLSITSVTAEEGLNNGNYYVDANADGTFNIKYTIKVKNTGNVDLHQGEENYSISAFRRSYESTTLSEGFAIPFDLAVGEESEAFMIDVVLPSNARNSGNGWAYYDLKDNLSGNTANGLWTFVTAYEPVFLFREANSTSTENLTAAQAYGIISEETTKSFEIFNNGAAPLTIKRITVPEGFTSEQATTTEQIIQKKEKIAVDVTLPITTTGPFSGNLEIVYLDKDNAEQTFSLPFSGTVLAEGTWTADFNNSSKSVLFPEGSVAESGVSNDYSTSSPVYDYYLFGQPSTSYATENNKFITPLLHANAGDKMTFDVARRTYSSASKYYFVKVYTSTDRVNWGEPVAEIYREDLSDENFANQSITFDVEGDYYVAFALYGMKLDNIVGLQKVDVAHDLYIKSVSWPDASIKNGSAQTKPSVEFIPLTNEAADDYTVKYVCGETVLGEGTPVALTASANSSKTIAINWTPNVESTTTFEGTKVVFEFTDGTKFETETFDLTVTNEPIFHFVKTLPSSKWYEPTDYTTPITFGKTNTADSQTFYINNWGSAPLSVKSISLPAGFSTSVETPLTVAAFNGETDGIAAASQALDIIFSATEAGEYSGDMVITYVNAAGEDATFTLAVSGTKLDPDAWYANFDDGGWPAGSVYQDNVSITNGGTYSVPNYYITSSSATNNLFITPKLTSTAGDKLAFDAKLYSGWNEGKVVVYAAATRDELVNFDPEADTRTAIFTASGAEGSENLLTTDYQTFEIPAVAGDNYYAFEISGRPYVDELYGLKLADVAHDWMIASSNIPTEAMQNVASTASVNILNLGLKDEVAADITVTAYVNGETVATGEGVAIPMSHKLSDEGTKFSINFVYPKVGTFPVYLEVKAGDYSVKTEPVDVTFAEEVAMADAIEVGSGTTTSYSYAPIDFFNFEQARTSDILYTKAQLTQFGLKKGDKITTLAFKGTASSAKTMSNSSLKAWVALNSGDITYGSPDKTAMTEIAVYNAGEMVFTSGVNVININLPEAITYDGTSDLRIYLEGGGNSEWVSLNFAYDTNYSNMKWSNATSMKYNPLLYVTLEDQSATLAGNVRTSAGAGIANATVTLKAENGIEYSATSDAEGNYSMNVVQGGLDFTATVEAEGFLKREFAENLGGVSKTLDVVMYKQYGILGNIPGFDWDNDVVMTQDEENPMVFTLVKDVVVETAGDYNYKMRADGAWAGNEEGQLAHGYELPASGNNTVNFPSAGTYVVTFTADVDQHSLDAEVALKTFTLAENACEKDQPNIFEITSEIANLTVVRTFNAGWNAVVLPFALTQEEVTTTFGEGSKVAYFNGDTEDANGNVTVKFDELTGDLDANVPYMIYVATATTNPTFNNKTFVDPHGADLKAEVLGTAFDFMGTYVNLDVNAGDMFVSGGKFKTATTNNYVRAFRAYLKSKTEGARQVNIFVNGEEISIATPTAIDGIDVDNVDGNVYNINGQRVNKNVKHGVYIINGKKVVRK